LAEAFVVAAPSSGAGKTMVTLGLLRALRNRGRRVSSAKVGPDYIDARFHEAASGRACLNLDPWAMDKDLLLSLLLAQAEDADTVIVEGVMGLFDGPLERGSTADLAQMLGLPVILVVDAARQAQSVAALVHGFKTYRQDIEITGVILNKVASERHEKLLRIGLAERHIPVLGAIHRAPHLTWPSRHLGLVQAQEYPHLEAFIAQAAATIEAQVLLHMLPGAQLAAARGNPRSPLSPPGQKIALACDDAFGFLYAHVVQGWRAAGAEIALFSPLNGEVPAADADFIVLPGGYPELHAGKLAASTRFLNALRTANAPIYGECGGYMVLGDALIDAKGESHGMAGLLPVTTSFADRKLTLGYRSLKPLAGPWTKPLRAHEFHFSTIHDEGAALRLFEAEDAEGHALGAIGLRRGNVMGSYAHVICEAG
jgi:cobyrinic acid a,c-diamide synthase